MGTDAESEGGAGASGGGAPAYASTGGAPAVSTEGLEEFNLDSYDDDPNDGGMQIFSVLKEDVDVAKEPDPYLKGDPDSDSDSEDFYEITPEDQVFVAASCEEENCMLEVYVFNEEQGSMYVHHDIMLGAYPLCVEWIGQTQTTQDGCFGAVGLIDHCIQIWDLNDQEGMEPSQSLGDLKKQRGKKKKGSSSSASVATAHDGAILCMHGSPFNRSVLCSGSGDHKLKVWDVAENACIHEYTHHNNKVQCCRWHPTEQAVLLSASFDRHLALLDVRQPNASAMVALPAEAESAFWSRHRPFEALASADNGGVACYDVRKVVNKAPDSEKCLWRLQAHDVACTAVTDAPAKDLLITTGLDGVAKVWKTGAGSEPKLAFAKNLAAGPLFTCQTSVDSPALACFGGKCPVMWDLSSESVLVDAFPDLAAEATRPAAA